MTQVLLVISDPNVGVVLSEYLRLKEFGVELCSTPSEAYTAAAKNRYDFCVLGLDDKEALLQLTADIRQASETPVFALQNTFDKDEQMRLYDAGADDCLVQPLVPDLLICKMQAMLRRWNNFQSTLPQVFDFPGFHFDSITHTLRVVGGEVHLTPKESAVLLLLCQNANQTLDRSRILKEAWRSDSYFNARSLSVYINRLRHILEPNSPLRIISIRTRGYKLLVP